jgi:hypothetical protein
MKAPLILLLVVASVMASCKTTLPNDDPDWIRNKPSGQDLGVPIRILETEPEDWVELATPTVGKNYVFGRVYVGQISKVFYRQQLGFLISGDLPNACSELHSVTTEIKGDEIVFQIQSRQEPDVMCAEMLRPFNTFIDILDEDDFARVRTWKSDEATGNF